MELLDSASSRSLCNKEFLKKIRTLFPNLKVHKECHKGITVDNRIVNMNKVVDIPITIESKTINTKLTVLDKSSDEVTTGLDLFSYLDTMCSIPKRMVSVGRYDIQLPLILEFYSSGNFDCSQGFIGPNMFDESAEGN